MKSDGEEFRKSLEQLLGSAIDRLRLEGLGISHLGRGYRVAGENVDLALVMEDQRPFILEIAGNTGTRSRGWSWRL